MSQQITLTATPTSGTPNPNPDSKSIYPTLFYRQNNIIHM